MCETFKNETNNARSGRPTHIVEDKGGNSAELLGKIFIEAEKWFITAIFHLARILKTVIT